MKRTLDADHVPQKKNKLITHFPDGVCVIPFEMQRMVSVPLVQIHDNVVYNQAIDAMVKMDKDSDTRCGAIYNITPYQLYILGSIVLIYDWVLEKIFVTKDSPIHELNPEYWANL